MEEQPHIASVNVAEELARKDQQLERLRQAYLDLQEQAQQLQQQQQNRVPDDAQLNATRDRIFKMINHMPTFTGTGEVTVNSFFSGTEYLLSTILDENIKKDAVRTIFYKVIQGQAKDVVINIPTPDDWQLIKETLKLRYRPNVEPHQLYRMIANLKVNTVSELIVEIQNIKYKADELTVYYHNDHYIDLSNIDSLLVNTVKEMTQGTLLDKIYEERYINDILRILTIRRFEDTCIRPEYRRFRNKDDKTYGQNQPQNKKNFSQQMYNNKQGYNQQGYPGQTFRQNYNSNNNFNVNKNFNNSGQYRMYNNRINNPSGNFQRFGQTGPYRTNVNQERGNQTRQNTYEPMEVDNLEASDVYNNTLQQNDLYYNNQSFSPVGHPRPYVSQHCLTHPRQNRTETIELSEIDRYNNNTQGSAQLGNPRPYGSQYRLTSPRQERNGSLEHGSEELNYGQRAGNLEPDLYQLQPSQDQFFSRRHRTTYPS